MAVNDARDLLLNLEKQHVLRRRLKGLDSTAAAQSVAAAFLISFVMAVFVVLIWPEIQCLLSTAFSLYRWLRSRAFSSAQRTLILAAAERRRAASLVTASGKSFRRAARSLQERRLRLLQACVDDIRAAREALERFARFFRPLRPLALTLTLNPDSHMKPCPNPLVMSHAPRTPACFPQRDAAAAVQARLCTNCLALPAPIAFLPPWSASTYMRIVAVPRHDADGMAPATGSERV